MKRCLLLAALIAMAAAGCGGEEATYNTKEVVAAFGRHGYELVEWEAPAESAPVSEGDLLVTNGDQPFFWVAVATDATADDVWPEYESQQTQDSFTARRGNVVTSADAGLDTSARERVLAALRSLPERGHPVVVARNVDP